MNKDIEFVVIRVAPNGDYTHLNVISNRRGNFYRSAHKELDGLVIDTPEKRKDLAEKLALGWARLGPWTNCKFIVKDLAEC